MTDGILLEAVITTVQRIVVISANLAKYNYAVDTSVSSVGKKRARSCGKCGEKDCRGRVGQKYCQYK